MPGAWSPTAIFTDGCTVGVAAGVAGVAPGVEVSVSLSFFTFGSFFSAGTFKCFAKNFKEGTSRSKSCHQEQHALLQYM